MPSPPTTASGATFVGFPGIAYDNGMAAIWSVFLYPIGIYLGVLVCLKVVSNSGHEFGNRSIPEYLGSRYLSDGVRIMVSLFSLLLFFYLGRQLVSGIVMFELMLGVPSDGRWASPLPCSWPTWCSAAPMPTSSPTGSRGCSWWSSPPGWS